MNAHGRQRAAAGAGGKPFSSAAARNAAATQPPVLVRDARFVVLDKPAGLKVHPGPGGGPSVEDWFPALRTGRDGPWLVHRLDADTSGCLVVALRRAALIAAQRAFAERRVRKTYWAVVAGVPPQRQGRIDVRLSKQTGRDGWRMRPDEGGQAALTLWRLRATDGRRSWLELEPRTGRTHQLRLHCAMLGCPIVGDALYGSGADGETGLHLLARAVDMSVDPPLRAEAPPNAILASAIDAIGGGSAAAAEDEP